jgi:Caspase domain
MKNSLLLLFCLLAVQKLTGQPTTTVSAKSDWVSVKKSSAAAPVIAWRTPLTAQQTALAGTYRLTVCIQSDSPLTRVVVIQNGIDRPSGQRGFKRVACGQELSEEITLVSGSNKVLVEATNAVGTTRSEPRFITGLSDQPPVAIRPTGQKRLALVMANAAYAKYPLRNPLNDGRAIKAHLENLGFVVTYGENLPLRSLKTTIETFMTSLGGNTVGLVYYAGHGLMVNGENYLQPVDADPTSETDVEYECFPMRRLIARLEQVNGQGANLVFWDACRSNPYRSWRRSAGDPVFAPVQPAVGTLIVYATEPGKPAYDGGNDPNSLFTGELLRHIDQPNMDVFDLVDRIDRGLEARGVKQPPYIEGRLRGKFFFKPSP